jgi:hypothetical protein
MRKLQSFSLPIFKRKLSKKNDSKLFDKKKQGQQFDTKKQDKEEDNYLSG